MCLALESQLEDLRELQNKQEQKKVNTKYGIYVLEQHITSEFIKLYQFLHEEEEQLMKQLRDEEMVILQKVEHVMEKIQEKADIIKTMIADIHLWLQQQKLDTVTLLKDARNLITQSCEEMLEDADSNQELGMFRGPLLYTVWKKMNSIIFPVPSPLLLDPETANSHLVLSDDLRSVTYRPTSQQYYDNPKRFTGQFAVLGFDGVMAGRHYWEVIVENKNEWNIGVIKESVKRNSNTEKKPEKGFWSLYLMEYDILKAMTSTPQVLNLTRKPQKVGVYLDYEGGQVSFYDATNMSHLYTFTDIFTETLYLYLNPCDNEFEPNLAPLELFHLKL
ncbi:zinc-binding protein A33-like [Protopterus annectens]|uniref:zinc-binding protein A33-like n=1 Tax=Protopterus annectens TaxID=7888 RepID=UPI001CFB1108|nr:zinc-binding protein A33-like [Protopterus annectens]